MKVPLTTPGGSNRTPSRKHDAKGRPHRFVLNLSDDEKRDLNMLACDRGWTLAAWLREQIRREARAFRKDHEPIAAMRPEAK